MGHKLNLLRIKAVHNALGALQNEVVFVGGATASLYVDRMTEEARPTNDVDIVVELWAYKDYAAIESKLRLMGFENDTESNILCRFKVQGIIVDIIPTGENVLGFSNKWYPEGFKNAIKYDVDKDTFVKIFGVNYFIASKLEAFNNRGNNDGRTSADFEDIIYVLENRKSIWDDLENVEMHVKKYLKSEFKKHMQSPFFEEWVDAHSGHSKPPATYFILERLEEFIKENQNNH